MVESCKKKGSLVRQYLFCIQTFIIILQFISITCIITAQFIVGNCARDFCYL